MEIKCNTCGHWFQFDDYKKHPCLNKSANNFKHLYFFGPEIDSDGNIYHLESEDGKTWFRKLVKLSDESLHRKQPDGDLTEPIQALYKGGIVCREQ